MDISRKELFIVKRNLILMLVCLFVFTALPAFGANPSSGYKLQISDEMAKQHVKQLKAMMKEGKTDKEFKFEATALKNGKQINVPVKSATMKLGEFTTEDGNTVDAYTSLASSEIPLDSPKELEYAGITSNIHMYWHETLPEDYAVYINFDKGYGWWERNSTMSYVQDGLFLGKHCLMTIEGLDGGDIQEKNIGTPTWSSGTTGTYRLDFPSDDFTLKENAMPNEYFAFLQSDIYYQNDKIYNNFKVNHGF